jgi:hypothetical protein
MYRKYTTIIKNLLAREAVENWCPRIQNMSTNSEITKNPEISVANTLGPFVYLQHPWCVGYKKFGPN